MDLGRYPRTPLAHLPTPLEPLPRLSEALGGPRLYVKRDDATGLALGGNKTRKLEFLMAEAQAEGADCIITAGGVQSNHVRQSAAAAAKLGLDCELVLNRNVPWEDPLYDRTGNVLLDRLLGAKVHIHPAGTDRDAAMEELAAGLRDQGRRPYIIPVGGSNPVGSLGYVSAALELAGQAEELAIGVDYIIHGCSSGGTHAGLACGLAALGHPAKLRGIDVDGDPALAEEVVRPLTGALANFLALDEAAALAQVAVVPGYAGDGYGLPTEAMLEAVAMAARCEGLILDPVYTGKAMAGLIGLIREGAIEKDATAIFIHSGGMPALFAYQSLFENNND